MNNILITGCSGEMGHGLINQLRENYENLFISAIDLAEPNDRIKSMVSSFTKADITNKKQIAEIVSSKSFDTVYHLAAILSTQAAHNQMLAHDVNVNGTLNIIESVINSQDSNHVTKIFFPSSIAVYNVGTSQYKPLNEDQCCNPATVYGAHKLYCEQIGTILSRNDSIDFRSIRFPGIISADTVPAGGTSDYGPEMLHAAIKGKSYQCFVNENAQIPFMTMPDAIKSISMIMSAESSHLSRRVYNVRGFAPKAKDFELEILKSFPQFNVSYLPNRDRQRMVDSWPDDVSDQLAARDWNWKPSHNLTKAFSSYLIPRTKEIYSLNT